MSFNKPMTLRKVFPIKKGYDEQGYIPVYLDDDKKQIIIGNHVITKPIFGFDYIKESKSNYLKTAVLQSNGIDTTSINSAFNSANKETGYSSFNKKINEHLGPKFYKRMKGYSYELWVKPHEALFKKCGVLVYANGILISDQPFLENAYALIDELEEALKYGSTLIPYMLFYKKSLSELKCFFGIDLFNTLSNLSFSKNREIALILIRMMFQSIPENNIFNSKNDIPLEIIKLLGDVRSDFYPYFIEMFSNVYYEKYQEYCLLNRTASIPDEVVIEITIELMKDMSFMSKEIQINLSKIKRENKPICEIIIKLVFVLKSSKQLRIDFEEELASHNRCSDIESLMGF